MRLPIYEETKAYLNDIGWDLERLGCPDGRSFRYELKEHDGGFGGGFDNLLGFWAYWVELASEVLSKHAIAQGFIDEYREATSEHRVEMLDWYEGWISCRDKGPYAEWLSKIETYTAETLPPDWAERMKRVAPLILGKNSIRVPQALADMDPVAKQRLKTFPERLGIPELPLITE